MKSIKILCRDEMVQIRQSTPDILEHTRVISINEPEEKPVFEVTHSNVLTVHFHDIDLDIWPDCVNHTRYVVFNLELARQVMKFIEESAPFDELIVHCYQGISRSGAIGAFACKYFKLRDSLREARKGGICPNKYILKILNDVAHKRNIELRTKTFRVDLIQHRRDSYVQSVELRATSERAARLAAQRIHPHLLIRNITELPKA